MKLTLLILAVAALASAGPLKLASYPVRHPVKTSKGLKTATVDVAKASYKVTKAIVW